MTMNELVGQNLRKYRIAHNYTLKKLSSIIHKSCSTLSKYEKGTIPISADTIAEFAEIFNIPPSHFLISAQEDTSTTKQQEFLKTYYMYTYDGRRKRIMKSVIEEFTTSEPDVRSIQLFYDVESLEHFEKCAVIYSGESTLFGPWQNYHLRNLAHLQEEIWMCTLDSFSQNEQKTGILSGISQLTMQPCSRKVITTSKVQKDADLMDELMLTKDSISLIKKTNIFNI